MVLMMRKTLIALPLLLASTPAMAQQGRSPIDLPKELTDPAAQMRLAAKLQSISNALLNVKVGDLAAALDGREASAEERNLTVGDVVRKKDPTFDRDVAHQVAVLGPKIQNGVREISRTLPRVMQDVADAQKAIDRAVANLPDPSYPQR